MSLPAWPTTLVVVAHPDDESFGLGAVIDAFVTAGSRVSVLCLTRGEASTLGAALNLGEVRAAELAAAGHALGLDDTTLLDHPDGALADVPFETLTGDIDTAVARVRPAGLLVFDPSGVTGHPDHVAATAAAVASASAHGLPVLAWTLPSGVCRQIAAETGVLLSGEQEEGLVRLRVDRTRQRDAITAHASQAVPGSILWRRLELLGDHEYLRWLLS